MILDVDGEVPELRELASYYATKGGALWVAEDEGGAVVGMVAALPCDEADPWEIARMYVARPFRGTGLAHRLLDGAEAHARAAGARRLRLWSDTRFRSAHRFYEKRSYVRVGPLRVLGDRSCSLEFGYAKPLAGIMAEALGAAATASAARVLGRLAPRPEAYWRTLAAEAAAGRSSLIVAWNEGVIVGSLELAIPRTGPACLEQLLLAPDARGETIGAALLAAAERAAGNLGLPLLTAAVPDGAALQPLLIGAGWTLGGRIPRQGADLHGERGALSIYWRVS